MNFVAADLKKHMVEAATAAMATVVVDYSFVVVVVTVVAVEPFLSTNKNYKKLKTRMENSAREGAQKPTAAIASSRELLRDYLHEHVDTLMCFPASNYIKNC